MIEKTFIRVWLGNGVKPPIFDQWWDELGRMHPGFKMLTVSDREAVRMLPKELFKIWDEAGSLSQQSDIIRYLLLANEGGVYMDCDVMPLKPFTQLLEDPRPFAGKRSSKSFEAAVIGCPKGHPAAMELLKRFPKFFWEQKTRSSALTGPVFLSSVWFGRSDVRHLPTKTFYPYNGFHPPKRHEKIAIFEKRDFPEEMIAAHFSNMVWGGKPKKKLGDW